MLVTGVTLIVLVILLAMNRFRASHVFLGALACLYISGQVSQEVVFNNITNRSIITLLLLLLSALVLERTVLLNWISKRIIHTNYMISLLRLGVISSISSAFLNNTAVVATLMGVVLKNTFHAPSKLLIPLSYFSILGGTVTLIGTSTNLVVNGLLEERGLSGLHVFDFFPVGGCLLLLCGITVVFMSRFLPQIDKSDTTTNEYFFDAEVEKESKLIGKTVIKNGLRALDGLFLVEIIRDGQLISPVSPEEIIHEGDKLIFSGDVSEVKQLSLFDGLKLYVEDEFVLDRNVTEVLVSPESLLVGRTLKEVEFRSRFDAAVVAISRQGKKLSGKLGECLIQSGDKLILAVGNDFHKRTNLSRNFFLLNEKKVKEPLSTVQNLIAIAGFLSAVLVAATTSISLIDTLGLFLLICMATKIVDGAHLRRHFPFELLVILISALCIASAFSNSGLATALIDGFHHHIGSLSLHRVLVGLLVFTVCLTEIMTNTAAAAIILPIALAIAQSYQVSYQPFVMAVAYGASASFISPFGYQTNLMVMNAGNYSVKDFVKSGWVITCVYIMTAAIAIPYFFPFTSN